MITTDHFSPKQQQQLNDLYVYCDGERHMVECLCALTFSDFVVHYYPKTGTFLCYVRADDDHRHRLGALTKEQYTAEDDLDPYTILFHPIIFEQMLGNGIGELVVDGLPAMTRYETHKRVYGTGYTLQNYLAADPVDQYEVNYYFRYDHTARVFHYSIDRTASIQTNGDYFNFYIGHDKSDMFVTVGDTHTQGFAEMRIEELQLLMASVFDNYLASGFTALASEIAAERSTINAEARKLTIDQILEDLA